MSGTFDVGDLDYTVSNSRFSSLFEWAVEYCEKNKEFSGSEILSKIRDLSENIFIPHTYVNFQDHFTIEELESLEKIFLELAYDIYERKIGNQSSNIWQPLAIADAIQISKLLRHLSFTLKEST